MLKETINIINSLENRKCAHENIDTVIQIIFTLIID